MLLSTALHSFTPPSLSKKPQSPRPPFPPPLPNSHLFSHPSSLLLELCADRRELHRLLPRLVKHGLLAEHIVQTKLLALFSRFGCLREASLVFSSVADRSDELHHSLLKGHSHHSPLFDSLSFFVSMRPVSVHNLTYLLKACADHSDVKRDRKNPFSLDS